MFAAILAEPAARAHHLGALVTAIGIGAWLALAVALVCGWPVLIGWALVLFGAAYALSLSLRGGAVDAASIPIAADLVLVAELAFASLDRGLAGADRVLALWTVARIAGAVAAATAIAGLILVASMSARPGLALEVAGAAAAVGCVAAVAWAASRTRESTST